jgi:hypothetical protein
MVPDVRTSIGFSASCPTLLTCASRRLSIHSAVSCALHHLQSFTFSWNKIHAAVERVLLCAYAGHRSRVIHSLANALRLQYLAELLLIDYSLIALPQSAVAVALVSFVKYSRGLPYAVRLVTHRLVPDSISIENHCRTRWRSTVNSQSSRVISRVVPPLTVVFLQAALRPAISVCVCCLPILAVTHAYCCSYLRIRQNGGCAHSVQEAESRCV